MQELAATQQHNAELRASTAQLSARLDEESEVVSALRAQLVDYRLQMGQMQMQAKKGRTLNTNNSTTGMLRRAGTATPPGQLGFNSITGGLWGMQGAPAGSLPSCSIGADGVLAGVLGSSTSGHLLARAGSVRLGAAAAGSGHAGDGDMHLARLDLEQQRQQQPSNR